MKVVHLISGGDVGGAKTYIEALLPELNTKGIETWLLCVMEGALTAECRRRGVNVKVIPQRFRWDLSVAKKIAEWIKDEKIDILHCHGARANFIAFFLRLYVKIPFITTLHSDYLLDFAGSGWRRLLYTPLNVISLKSFSNFIAISGVFKEMLVERGFKREQIEVVHNGVDFENMPPPRPKAEFLAEYGITASENTVIIGCAARLHPVKGIDVLLKAAARVIESGADSLILIAGSGNERQNLLSLTEKLGLSERVKFLGFVEDMASFYSTLDINVVPSYSEGFSLAIVEGARFKLSTIASRTGGIPEVIKDGETGILFTPGDFGSLAEILLNEINSPDDGKKRGERLYSDVYERFSIEKTAARHLEVYSMLLKGDIK